MNNVIEVRNLDKVYGEFKAVNNANFTIEENKIYGLLGRNGAGKTTLMNMITAQLFPTQGDLQVFGVNPYENTRALDKICFIKEAQKYPDNFRVIDVMEVAKTNFANWDQDFADALVDDFNLPLKSRVKKLSRGMLSSVGIIIGLASRAPLTIFDEPYLGLDAVARQLFYQKLMDDYAEYPRTVILSTHLIDEVSNLLEHIIVIDQGEIIINEEAEEIRGIAYTVTGQAEKVEAFLTGKETIHKEPFGGLLSATVIQSNRQQGQQQAATQGLEVTPVSLQQLVVHLTNQKSNRKGVHAS